MFLHFIDVREQREKYIIYVSRTFHTFECIYIRTVGSYIMIHDSLNYMTGISSIYIIF